MVEQHGYYQDDNYYDEDDEEDQWITIVMVKMLKFREKKKKKKNLLWFADFCEIEFGATPCKKAKPNLIKKSQKLGCDIQPPE